MRGRRSTVDRRAAAASLSCRAALPLRLNQSPSLPPSLHAAPADGCRSRSNPTSKLGNCKKPKLKGIETKCKAEICCS